VITLSEEQWSLLKKRDTASFVDSVCEQYVRTHRAFAPGTTREQTLPIMQAAYEFAERAGFTSTPHIVHLMYFAADAPGVLDEPAVIAQLRKPGATPERRFDDLLAVFSVELNRLEKGR
jgi:hypothetical protein